MNSFALKVKGFEFLPGPGDSNCIQEMRYARGSQQVPSPALSSECFLHWEFILSKGCLIQLNLTITIEDQDLCLVFTDLILASLKVFFFGRYSDGMVHLKKG